MKHSTMRAWFAWSESTRSAALVVTLTLGMALWWGGNLAQLGLM